MNNNGWINVYACVDSSGVVYIWTKTRTYPNKKAALDEKDVKPTSSYVYVGTVLASKLPIKMVAL